MNHIHILDAIWVAAIWGGPKRSGDFDFQVEETVRTGFVERCRIVDFLLAAGVPWVPDHGENIVEVFGHKTTMAYPRPKSGKTEVLGFEALAAADFVDVLIRLECFGIDAGAQVLASALRPALTKRPMLSQSELAVYWYKQRCRSTCSITIDTDDEYDWPGETAITAKARIARFENQAGEPVIAACPGRWSANRAEKYFMERGCPFLATLNMVKDAA